MLVAIPDIPYSIYVINGLSHSIALSRYSLLGIHVFVRDVKFMSEQLQYVTKQSYLLSCYPITPHGNVHVIVRYLELLQKRGETYSKNTK